MVCASAVCPSIISVHGDLPPLPISLRNCKYGKVIIRCLRRLVFYVLLLMIVRRKIEVALRTYPTRRSSVSIWDIHSNGSNVKYSVSPFVCVVRFSFSSFFVCLFIFFGTRTNPSVRSLMTSCPPSNLIWLTGLHRSEPERWTNDTSRRRCLCFPTILPFQRHAALEDKQLNDDENIHKGER